MGIQAVSLEGLKPFDQPGAGKMKPKDVEDIFHISCSAQHVWMERHHVLPHCRVGTGKSIVYTELDVMYLLVFHRLGLFDMPLRKDLCDYVIENTPVDTDLKKPRNTFFEVNSSECYLGGLPSFVSIKIETGLLLKAVRSEFMKMRIE